MDLRDIWESRLWAPALPFVLGIVLFWTGPRLLGIALYAAGFLGFLLVGMYWRRQSRRAAFVTVHLPVSSDFGTPAERRSYQRLAERLEERVQASGAGEYDGDGAGEGTFDLYFIGEDQERVPRALRTPLKAEGVYAKVTSDRGCRYRLAVTQACVPVA